MLRSDNDADKERFRSLLIESIIMHPSLNHLSPDKKKSLIGFLTEQKDGLIVLDKSDTQIRLRALTKAASDAKRLAHSLTLLNKHDIDVFNLTNSDKSDLSERTTNLKKMAQELETIAQHRVEDTSNYARKARMLRALYAWPLITKLQEYEISTTIRNDFASTSAYVQPNESVQYLPDVQGNATVAMRCIMLALHSSNSKNLDWSLTVSLIKLGKPLVEQTVIQTKALLKVKEIMTPYVNQLHYAMSLTVDALETHTDDKQYSNISDRQNQPQPTRKPRAVDN
ncbi:hypothetical protein [Pseudomonas ficuserectae]|uniref:hypothetical protein n=1 Tax=Pseudomonas ficuserectae TaxID=53410 RepID=UPI0006D6204A|nr:hypothetical protein [Pseudomonas ficuserectae]KPX25629.1 hypothetical protein ALO69_102092 [Pseudomonas ficuserectae]RMS37064.1 hypothetical protein ALP67_101727 [Pseudomonas ficuserectae]RMS38258.1 hypothetical protein ALP68_101844 [Pseudomonas ficuserectae]